MAGPDFHSRQIRAVWAPRSDMLGLLQLRPPLRPCAPPTVSRSIVETFFPSADADRAPVARRSVIRARGRTCSTGDCQHHCDQPSHPELGGRAEASGTLSSDPSCSPLLRVEHRSSSPRLPCRARHLPVGPSVAGSHVCATLPGSWVCRRHSCSEYCPWKFPHRSTPGTSDRPQRQPSQIPRGISD